MKALVFAAGLGTRLGPITKDIPKALVSVGGEPMLGRVLRKLSAEGFDDVVVTACYKAGKIKDWLASEPIPGMKVRLSVEPGPEPFETGGGIKFAEPLLRGDGPFLAHNVDILSDADLAEFVQRGLEALTSGGQSLASGRRATLGTVRGRGPSASLGGMSGGAANRVGGVAQSSGALAALLVTEPRPEDDRFFLFDPADMRLRGWMNSRTGEVRGFVREALSGADGEKPGEAGRPDGSSEAPSVSELRRMSFCGIHLISQNIFPLLDEWPERFSITDLYIKEAARHRIYGIPAPWLKIIDIGSPETLAEAESTCKKG